MRESIYLSGPNYPAFKVAAESMRAAGLYVISPHEINVGCTDYAQCMKNDIRALLQCEVIAMMPGWSASIGAGIERKIAIVCGLRISTPENEIKRAGDAN